MHYFCFITAEVCLNDTKHMTDLTLTTETHHSLILKGSMKQVADKQLF